MAESATVIQLALLGFVVLFLLFYVIIYAFRPKRTQLRGPDRRPTGTVCMRTAVVVSSIMALLATGLLVVVYMAVTDSRKTGRLTMQIK